MPADLTKYPHWQRLVDASPTHKAAWLAGTFPPGLPSDAITPTREWDVTQPSRGLGDTVAKITHATGIAAAVHGVSKITGKPCNCPERQKALNTWWPYKAKDHPITADCLPPIRPATNRKVAFALPALAFGGVERWLASLIANLPPSIEVTGVGVPSAKHAHAEAVSMIERHAPVFVGTQWRDAIDDAGTLVVWGLTGLKSRLKGYTGRLVCAVHDSDADWTMKYVRESLEVGAEIVAVSDSAADFISFVPPERMTIIHNGVDVERFRSSIARDEARRRLGIPAEMTVFAYMGRLVPEKRWELLPNAIASTDERYGCLIVGGTGKSSHRTWFVEHTYDIADVLVAADAVVGLSKREGFWLAGMEAAAMGLPLISTSVGILPTIANQYGTLWTDVPMNCESGLAVVLQKWSATESAEKARRLQEVVQSRFTAEKMGQAWGVYLAATHSGDRQTSPSLPLDSPGIPAPIEPAEHRPSQ